MTAKSDADLLREILVFIHIPAQQAALERAIKMAETPKTLEQKIIEKCRRYDELRRIDKDWRKDTGGFWD